MSTAAAQMKKTPLESWIAARVVSPALTREELAAHQLNAFRETVLWARRHGSFYAQKLAAFPAGAPLDSREIAWLPFTTPTEIAQNPQEFLCVSQDEISRVVTLNTSGTSGTPKRIFFTAEDQELALEFFAHGVAAMAAPGDRMLIALPGEREGSVGYQLAKGIARAGVIPIPHGLVIEPAITLTSMEREKATCIIGLPVQMLALGSHKNALRKMRSIVLCSDHVPESLLRRLRQLTDAEIFQHYGMTEMGMGGGIDCEAHSGYHLREADFYFEIVDPASGAALPDGEMGEIVFTTLHRTGMPLIRYRSGDMSRFLPNPCGCGTILKRLERVRNRVNGFVPLGPSGYITIAQLDEALFAIPALLDYTAAVYPLVEKVDNHENHPSGAKAQRFFCGTFGTTEVVPFQNKTFATSGFQGAPLRLELAVHAPGNSRIAAEAHDALHSLPILCNACENGEVEVVVTHTCEPFPATGAKRKIEVHPAQ